MATELTPDQQADICAVHVKLGEAQAIVSNMMRTRYLRIDEAQAVVDQIEKLQAGLIKTLISGELPVQPAPVVQRSFIGKKD